ncbi:MAG TPA: hypothetical protein VHE78_09380 [Gemmatimonadaceae bacterium]|nr:hypothetical protein [Gemmatimonadaceae bacterium]
MTSPCERFLLLRLAMQDSVRMIAPEGVALQFQPTSRMATPNRVRQFSALFIAALAFASLAHSQVQRCSPATPEATRAHLSLVLHALDTFPRHPIHLFRLAADYVALCEDSVAFDALNKMADSYGGLDPSLYRSFSRVQSSTRFREIVAKIRQRNLPIVASRVAFTLARPDLFPEGMAYDSATRRVYAGSTARNIVWTDSTGTLHDLVSSGQDGLGAVLGLHIDARRHHLWAVSTGASGPGAARAVRGLFQYDLADGKLIARYAIPDTSAEYTFNDVVVVPSTGIAYTTHTPRGSVYAAVPGDALLREIVPPGSLPQANGITVGADDSALFVAAGFGVSKVDLRTRRVTTLELAPGVVAATLDGLYRYGRSLIGIQNGVHPGRVMRFDLDSTLSTITRAIVLEAYNPLFDRPTTGAVSGESFFFMANPNQGRGNAGQVQDPANLKPVLVLRLSLRP